jgi:hypothetical protein
MKKEVKKYKLQRKEIKIRYEFCEILLWELYIVK